MIPNRIQIGQATLIRCNCLQVLQSMPDESIDSFVTDPPYGIELNLKWHRNRPATIAGDGRAQAVKLWQAWLPHAVRLAKSNTAHLIFGSWKSIWMKELLEKHFTVKGCIVWDKKCPSLGWHLRPRWELIWLVHKGKPAVPAKAQADVWQICRELKPQHPCQKPVELLRRCIDYVCPPGGLICDPFSGIGSTAVAAAQEQRRFIGVELAARYHQLAARRLQAP
jgi:adenine-specific DNA-methyltransferase